MRFYTDDVRPLPCGCSPSELRFFDEDGAELEDVLEFEQFPNASRVKERIEQAGKTLIRERFGQYRAMCKHSRPYTNGHAAELDP